MGADNIVGYQCPVYGHQELPEEPLSAIIGRMQKALTPPLFLAFSPVPDALLSAMQTSKTTYLKFERSKDDHQC